MKAKSDPKTMDHVIRMEMARQEYYAHMKRAREEGAYKKAIESAKEALSMGLTAEQAQRITGLSLSEVQALQ